jgi:Zn-dependent protease
MRGAGSIQLFRIFGIRIGVDVSWFVVLFLFIVVLSGSFRSTLDGSDGQAYAVAVASALLFFTSLIFHELGHALVARRLGHEIAGIDLFFFGGIAKQVGESRTPGEEFKVAIAGPLVTLGVVIGCIGAGVAAGGRDDFLDAATLVAGGTVSPALLLLSWLAMINALVFVFNLVPAFPLDGGRIARAAVWRLTGDRNRATRFASALGVAFSYVLIGLGILALVNGLVGTGVWSIAIGWFLGAAARGEAARSAFTTQLGAVTVADIMDREPVAIPAEARVGQALDEYVLRYRWPWFPVTDARGRFLGVVQAERVQGAERGGGHDVAVRDVMEPEAEQWRVAETTSLDALIRSEPLHRLGAVMAVDAEGRLRGVVTADQLRRALAQALAPGTG